MELEINDAPWVQASGCPEQLLTIRSVLIKTDDPKWQPVLDYAAEHELVVADSEVLPIPGMMFGKAECSLYMTRTAMRDGRLAYCAAQCEPGESVMRMIFASEIAEHAELIRQGFVFPRQPK